MGPQTLEARVARLEEQMDLLTGGRSGQGQPPADDWRQSVGMFRADPIVQEMLDESRRMREEDRRRTRETTEEGSA